VSHRGATPETAAGTDSVRPVTAARCIGFADRASRAYDERLATIRVDATLSDGCKVERIAAIYAQLVTMLHAFEMEWIRSLHSRLDIVAIERARWPFVPRPVPDEVW
jgi:hypothetical protein